MTSGRNYYVKLFREAGVTDKQRKELREIMREFEVDNVYDTIQERNQQVFNEMITPAQINYQNIFYQKNI